MLGFTIAVVALCLLVESFHSGSEIAMYSADRLSLRHKAEQGSSTAKMALRFVENTDLLLGTTLVGTNVSTVTATIAITTFMIAKFGTSGEFYAILVMSPLTLLFGELIPKSIFQKHANLVVRMAAYPLWLSSRLFYPIGWALTRVIRLGLRVIGVKIDSHVPVVTRADLRFVLKERTEQGDIQAEEETMVRRILEFRETTVQHAMKPLVDVHGFREDRMVKEVLPKIAGARFSRYPIFHERIVNIVGIVAVQDLLYCQQPEMSLKRFSQPVMYVPETARIEKVFPRMQKQGVHMAVAVDEYGGAVGIITLEDILEEIVGEIEDEYDEEQAPYRKVDDRHYLFKARTEIDRINELLGVDLPKRHYETLAGFIIHQKGRIPPIGTRLEYGGLAFLVTRSTDRSVEEVYVTIKGKGDTT